MTIKIKALGLNELSQNELNQVVGGSLKKYGKHSIKVTKISLHLTSYYQSFNNQNAQNFNHVTQLGGYLNVSTNEQAAYNMIV